MFTNEQLTDLAEHGFSYEEQEQVWEQAKEANRLREENERLRNKGVRGHSGCEGCGIVSEKMEYKLINLLNGALFLCLPCLTEFNSKNPEVKALKEENEKLKGKIAFWEGLATEAIISANRGQN